MTRGQERISFSAYHSSIGLALFISYRVGLQIDNLADGLKRFFIRQPSFKMLFHSLALVSYFLLMRRLFIFHSNFLIVYAKYVVVCFPFILFLLI